MRICSLALFSMILSSTDAMATQWYVDGKNGNDGNSGTQSAPFRTGWKATEAAKPGDTVYVLPTATYAQFGIMTSGTSSAPITIEGTGGPSNPTQIVSNGTNFGFQVNNGASYIVFENFAVTAPGTWSAIYVGNNSTHVTITGNIAYNSGHCGITTTHADYLTITDNTIYGNAYNTSDGDFCSGIDMYENNNSDSNTGIKNTIAGNVIYDNYNTPTCNSSACYGNGTDSDGNGIILDDFRHTQSDNVVYNGKTLIENNVVFNNGGRGIYAYESDHGVIVSNTVYHNNWDSHEAQWRPGEIGISGGGGDFYIYNNVAYSTGATISSSTGMLVSISVESATDGVGQVMADYNLLYNQVSNAGLMYYNGSDPGHTNTNNVFFGGHNLFANPNFYGAGTTPSTADFRLSSTSEGRGTGYQPLVSPTDILGVTRPTAFVDIGAYQQTTPGQCGSANGILALIAPVTGLCGQGSSSTVSLLGGLWSWSCSLYGMTVNCSAPQ